MESESKSNYRGRVQTTLTEFSAILTLPPPPYVHMYTETSINHVERSINILTLPFVLWAMTK